MSKRPTRLVVSAQVVGLIAAAGVAVWRAEFADWDVALLLVLLVFSLGSDLTAIAASSYKLKISGSFLALVLAMVFLGGAPAAAIGVATITVGWLRWRDGWHYLLNNLLTYAWFPLLGGIFFYTVRDAASLQSQDAAFYALIFATFALALGINFTMIASYSCYLERSSFLAKAKVLGPVLPSEIAAALMASGVAYFYMRIGLSGIVLFGLVLVTFQYLLGALLVSQERAEELARRTKQLASFQVGLLSALLHTLDLRDRMTARHSAAVARYSREIARRCGFAREDQELVHTAALLHDIGKFIFPDRILKANVQLDDDDWKTIRMHPHQGAQVVSQVDGYGPIAEIIAAHHERIDGNGYPRGLDGDEIPALSRIISVADTYDTMTARDSYREPVSSFEAIQELRRVAGSQLDPRFVEVFIEILSGKDVSYRHGEDADFDAELALEKRIHDHASPAGDRYLAGGVPAGA